MDTSETLISLYKVPADAQRAIDLLKQAGFASSEISLFKAEQQQPAKESLEVGGKGIVPGSAVGSALGLLAGIGLAATGAGAVVAPLLGAGAGGALGSLVGSLLGLGVKEEHAKQYELQVKGGAVLLAVHCKDDDALVRARSIFDDTKADSVRVSSDPV